MARDSSTRAVRLPSRMRPPAALEPPALPECLFGFPPRAAMMPARMDDLPVPFCPTMKLSLRWGRKQEECEQRVSQRKPGVQGASHKLWALALGQW